MGLRPIALVAAAAAVASLSSCGGTPAAPSSGISLRLTGTIAQAVITRGTPPVPLTFQLENAGQQAITLDFPSSCQITPYIVDRASGQIVYPAGGAWGCATVLTPLRLVPGGVAQQAVLIRAADSISASGTTLSLPPGQYSAYATVDASEIQLRSDAVTFSVQ